MVQGIRFTCDGFANTRDTLGSRWAEVSVLTSPSHSSHGYQKLGFMFNKTYYYLAKQRTNTTSNSQTTICNRHDDRVQGKKR